MLAVIQTTYSFRMMIYDPDISGTFFNKRTQPVVLL